MATAMKRLGVYLGLVEDDPNYDGYGAYGESVTPSALTPERPVAPVRELRKDQPTTVDVRATRPEPAPKAAPAAHAGPSVAIDPYSIHTIHPRSYNDARRIGEEYRAGSPVIMNLTEMSDNDAKRIVDFSAGLVFALHGSIERVTNKVFLLSPANVDVRDAPAVQQARDGFFNQS